MSLEQKALWLPSPGGPFKVDKRHIPKPGPGELLVKVHATALNPVDWKIVAGYFAENVEKYPAVLGCDGASTVEAIGEGVKGFTKGDRVIHQWNFTNDTATFQQYALVEAQFAAKVPDEISFEQAASIPSGLATASLGLYNPKDSGGAGLRAPWEAGGRDFYAGKPFIVMGGSTSVGQFVIQLAKLSGFSPIIATASLRNANHLKSLGATHVIDRNLPLSLLAIEVRKISSAPIEIVYDAVSEGGTQQAAYNLLTPDGAIVIVLPKDIVETHSRHIAHVYGVFPGLQNRKLGASLCSSLPELFSNKSIVPNKVEVLPDGLAGIPQGMERLRKQAVSAVKLVARPQDTPSRSRCLL